MNQMIKSGYVGWMDKPADEALRQDELCNRNMCSLARNFIDFGFTVLMDTVLADRTGARLLPGSAITATREACGPRTRYRGMQSRNATRHPDDHFAFDGYERLDDDMKREFGDVGWWFDTSSLTAEETAERLVIEAADRTSPISGGMARMVEAPPRRLSTPGNRLLAWNNV